VLITIGKMNVAEGNLITKMLSIVKQLKNKIILLWNSWNLVFFSLSSKWNKATGRWT